MSAESPKVKEAIAALDRELVRGYGERCKDFEVTCACCQAWRARDDLVGFIETANAE